MNGLWRILMVGVAVTVLMAAAVPLHATKKKDEPKPPVRKELEPNFLDALFIARADIVAARDMAATDTRLSPDAKGAVAKDLDGTLNDVDGSAEAWRKLYTQKPATEEQPHADKTSTLQDLLKSAATALKKADGNARQIGSKDIHNASFINVQNGLKDAASKVADVQDLIVKAAPEDNNKGQEGANFLDTLLIARADVVAAREMAAKDEKLLPAAKDAVKEKLDGALQGINGSVIAWRSLYTKKTATQENPIAGSAATLEAQLKAAATELNHSEQIAAEIGSSDIDKQPFKNVQNGLKIATTNVADAQELNKAVMEYKTKEKENPEREPGAWIPVVLSGLALLLAAIAIALVFRPVGGGEKARSQKKEMDAQLQRAKEQRDEVQGNLSNLKTEMGKLSKAVEAARKIADEAKSGGSEIYEEWDEKERRKGERRKEERRKEQWKSDPAPSGRVTGGMAGERVAEAAAVVPAKPKSTDALTGYNTARSMKAAERVTEYSRLYPKQMILACVNPSARNNGPFTGLRFKESDFGSFLAVLDDKQTLLFPELNYDYTTGRKTLEGVFVYPESESASYRLASAAVLEKKGDEWALVRQGVFLNG